MFGKDTTLIFYGRNVGGKLHKFLAETSAIRKAKHLDSESFAKS